MTDERSTAPAPRGPADTTPEWNPPTERGSESSQAQAAADEPATSPAAQPPRGRNWKSWLMPVLAVTGAIALAAAVGNVRYSAGYDDAEAAGKKVLARQMADARAEERDAGRRNSAALSVAETKRLAAVDSASSAASQGSSLRQQYDPQIRSELEAAVNAEVSRACADAKAQIDAPIDGLVRHYPAWEQVATREAIIQRVTECSAGERAKTAAQREADRLAACGTIPADTLEKDPAAAEGKCIVVYAAIVQYDVNTGKCSFHANFDNAPHDYSYEYSVRAEFNAKYSGNCPELGPIDADDLVKVWGTGRGTRSYTTALGGTNTVPVFDIEKIELRAKK